MRAMNQEVPPSKRVLELNPKHTILKQMKALFEKDKESERLGDYVDLLYGQALILEGSPVKAPQSFARIVSDLMMEGATK
jgi:molecular chaperone HtpG